MFFNLIYSVQLLLNGRKVVYSRKNGTSFLLMEFYSLYHIIIFEVKPDERFIDCH